MPQLVSATPYPNREGWITFKWKNARDAEQYFIQISRTQTFATLVTLDSTTTDTVRTLAGLFEGQEFYWRVRAKNIAGFGPWSDVSNFTLLYAPTDLVLRRSAIEEITLTWNNHSAVADGYVIERKQSPQTTFTLLDTLKGSGNEYVDQSVEQAQTYTYRTKAYTQSAQSDYSNEASLFVVVDVKKEEEIPTEYSMSQNYPNPFNPSTAISYQLLANSFVTLKVFDVLGREAAILVGGEQRAGYYRVVWDASGFTGGVYFYRLQAGDASTGSARGFVETKRMILLK